MLELQRPLGPFDLAVSIHSDAARIGLTGPSGSGKSTLLRILAGVDRRALGTVKIDGTLYQSGSRQFIPAWERRAGWLPQESLVFPHLSVRENLAYAAPNAESVAELARDLEIEGLLDRRAGRLSGGEAQRIGLGRALLSHPQLLLLDEPFSALDDSLKERVVRVLDQRMGDRPAFVVSHDRAFLERLGAELWTMDRGHAERL